MKRLPEDAYETCRSCWRTLPLIELAHAPSRNSDWLCEDQATCHLALRERQRRNSIPDEDNNTVFVATDAGAQVLLAPLRAWPIRRRAGRRNKRTERKESQKAERTRRDALRPRVSRG